MLKDFLEQIISYVKAASPVIKVGERDYFNVPGTAPSPILDPAPPAMKFNTLTGLVAWCKDHMGDNEGVYLVVENPAQVVAYPKVFGAFKQRSPLAIANHVANKFPTGSFMDPENFIIAALTRFAPSAALSQVLLIVGNVTDEAVRTLKDDGVSQQVTARDGLVGLSNVVLPNPVNLVPYQVFPEITGPEMPFVFRGRKGHAGAEFALFDTSDSQWRVEANKRTVEWLKANTALDVFA